MGATPRREDLQAALEAAGSAHHDYESRFLGGERDGQWAGWYSAYVLGRLGDFVAPPDLAGWLEATPGDGVWAEVAAELIFSRLQ